MANSDLARLINSDEIQSVVNAPKTPKMGKTLKKNPLKNLGAMLKLNPYAKTIRRQELAMAVRLYQCPHAQDSITDMVQETLIISGRHLHLNLGRVIAFNESDLLTTLCLMI
jgi:hypothetical protein